MQLGFARNGPQRLLVYEMLAGGDVHRRSDGPHSVATGECCPLLTWAVNHSMQNHYNIYNSIVGYSRHVQVTFH